MRDALVELWKKENSVEDSGVPKNKGIPSDSVWGENGVLQPEDLVGKLHHR